MTGKVLAYCRGFHMRISNTVRDSGIVFYGSLGPNLK